LLVIVSWPFTSIAAIGQAPDRTQELASQQSKLNPTTQEAQPKTPTYRKAEPAKEQHKRRGEFVIAPIPISSPALGAGIVPILGYVFHLTKNDTTSPPSAVGGVGLATNNGSRAFALGTQLYIKEDRYRLTGAFAHGNLNYNLYGSGITAARAGIKLPLEQRGQIFFGEFVRNFGWDIFVGPRFLTGNSTILRREGAPTLVAVPSDLGLRTNWRAIGVRLVRETRRNRCYPTNGTLLDFTLDIFSQAIGSKYSFQSYTLTFNKYLGLTKSQVLAYNAYFCATGGHPPFYGNCIYGRKNELRGYEAGRYLDRYMLATQLEYRLVLPKRFGLVGFGGVGGMAAGGHEFFRSENFLPSAGGGLRFLLSKRFHVNLRTDLARGKGDHSLSMGLTEAF